MKTFKKFCSATEKIMSYMVGYMLLIMTVLAFVGVISRYVIVVPILWIDEATRYLMVWMTFLVGALAVGDCSHTSVDIVPAFLYKRVKCFDFYIIIDLLILTGMIVFFHYNFQMVQASISTGNKTPVMKLPMWIMYCSTLVSALFSIVYCIRNIIVRVNKLRAPKDEKEGPEIC